MPKIDLDLKSPNDFDVDDVSAYTDGTVILAGTIQNHRVSFKLSKASWKHIREQAVWFEQVLKGSANEQDR